MLSKSWMVNCKLNRRISMEGNPVILYIIIIIKKAKCYRYRPGVAQRMGRGIALLFHDRGTRRGEWSAARPGRILPPGKTRYPLYRRLGGPQGRCGPVESLVLTGNRIRILQPVVSRYTDWATGITLIYYYYYYYYIINFRDRLHLETYRAEIYIYIYMKFLCFWWYIYIFFSPSATTCPLWTSWSSLLGMAEM